MAHYKREKNKEETKSKNDVEISLTPTTISKNGWYHFTLEA